MTRSRQSQSPLIRPLEPGDTIDLVAPGFRCKEEEFEAALAFIRNWGFKPRYRKPMFSRDLLSSAPDERRFDDLRRALFALDSKAVWCVRGGYGSIRLVPRLLRIKTPPRQPKIFVGLSDITTLHLFLNQVWKWPTIHGPMADRLGRDTTPASHVRELKAIVMGRQSEILFPRLRPMNAAARKTGMIRAPITGGNMAVLASSIGTPIQYAPKGQIVLLEDIGERGYRVDRMFEHFRQVGVWKGVRAVVFGEFVGSREPDGTDKVPAVMRRFAEEVPFPVFKGVVTGHGPIQRPVPFGTTARLSLGERGELIVPTGVSSGAGRSHGAGKR